MVPLSIAVLAAATAVLWLTYKLILWPALFSPLAKIPAAHWTSRISPLWILYHRIKHQNTFAVHEAHKRYGPVIRLAPNEVSINCVNGGLRTVYGGGYEKGDWYPNVFKNYGIKPMFAMEDRGTHSKRKRMISNVYAKTTLLNNPGLDSLLDTVLKERLLPQLQSVARDGAMLDMYDVFCAATLDVVAGYAVGLKNGSDLVTDLPRAATFSRGFKARQVYTVWPQDLPRFTAFMEKLGLSQWLMPEDASKTYENIEDWIMQMCKAADKSVADAVTPQSEDYPVVYAQLRSGMLRQAGTSKDDNAKLSDADQLEIASELVDHLMAGFDTSSITLTWLAWQLSRPQNATWQHKLNAELLATKGSLDLRTIDALPVLEAVLMESLRLHAAIPGNQPRITPANASLGPPGQEYHGLPANVRVQAQAWSLHRNPEVFPEPEEWQPARWLEASEAQRKEMARWFWAFGSGGRMCVGSNLAMLDMKAIIATIWGHFSTSIVFDEGMIPNGGYEAEPVGVNGRILEVRLRSLEL